MLQIFSSKHRMKENPLRIETKGKSPGKKGRAIRAVAKYLESPESDVTAKREGLGYSNIVYKVTRGEDSYLYKEYVSDKKSEPYELAWQKYFKSPRILYECKEYRIDEYIAHKKLSKVSVKDPLVIKSIAKELAKIHESKIPVKQNRYYKDILREERALLNKSIDSRRFFEICKKIERKIEGLYKESIFTDSCVLCHNDMQFGNILLLPSDRVMLIDFEHVSINIPTVDIAGFFNEASTNYKARGAPVSDRHFMHTPHAIVFIKAYLKERSISIEPGKVLQEIEKVKSVSDYYWFIWAVRILGKDTMQKGLDYFSFAMNRLEYLQKEGFITRTNLKEMKSLVRNRR